MLPGEIKQNLFTQPFPNTSIIKINIEADLSILLPNIIGLCVTKKALVYIRKLESQYAE